LTHRLLQSLPEIPPQRRAAAAENFIARAGKMLPAEDRRVLAERALVLLTSAQFGALFGPNSRAEVAIVGRIERGGKTVRVSGQIDRLAVTDSEVFIADYKTDRSPPRIAPPAYVSQLAHYRAVLQKLYPGRRVRAALIWTETTDLMELSADAMDTALAQVTSA
jgi:ATP-dependent helicase/nuclease subunit A